MEMAPIILKKPAVSVPVLPDPIVEPIQPSSVIVIHPGSMYLRIGRASDQFPRVVRHVIARRNRIGPVPVHKDEYLMPLTNMTPELVSQLDEIHNAISSVLASCLTREGRLRYSVPLQVIAEYNKDTRPDVVCGKSDVNWTSLEEGQEYVIGDEVLYLKPEENFNIHWPIRRGQLNVHSGIGGSLRSVLSDLETIWGTVIHKYLEIPVKDLKSYRAVLIIPDVYKRDHVKEMVNVLLTKLGFLSCFIHLESVCATFGAGVSYACVVDVGDQKTAVSCVEDGISHRNTRLSLNYGGNDITRYFSWLLEKSNFPYRCHPEKIILDSTLMQELKEKFCHVNLDVCGAQNRSFNLIRPCEPVIKYSMKVGDECLIAPLALFHPELLSLTGPKKIRVQPRYEGSHEDPHDEVYLIQTQRRAVKDTTEGLCEQSFCEETPLNSSVLDEDLDSTDQPPNISLKDSDQDLNYDQIFGIDQAIMQSIDRCDSDELKAKMYSCILVVGGGMMIHGIHTWLRNRLQVQIPIIFRSEHFEIITRPKDMDPRYTVWKGAALMSCLDTAQELWIKQKEWLKYNVKILREKAPFTW
ncbi:actin-related protein 8-like [Uloborus diversus]|uniref:actin-related protein 8-like n=1 Tax=Uloborus diversus TaxID=327109 RepID=UPI00240923B0|nr:actin-related protein 8-like [Uloborus diversus]